MNYKNKIEMKFSTNQLERIIIVLINNPLNKKFVSNVSRLFNIVLEGSYKNDYEKEYRVYTIKKITEILNKHNIDTKDSLLGFLEFDGKYYNECTELINNLFDADIPTTEVELLDKQISLQLKYSSVSEKASELNDILINIQNDNFDDMEDVIGDLEEKLDNFSRDIKSARESIEDSKKDLSLASSGFVNYLGKIIDKERNPDTKIVTGIQYLNAMLNGGFEKGRLYCALRGCERLEIWLYAKLC